MGADDIGTLVPQGGGNNTFVDERQSVMALDEAYRSGYNDAGGSRKASNSFDTKMLSMLMDCPMPSRESDLREYITMLNIVISILPKIPNYDMKTYREICRDFEDIIDQSQSEGMGDVVAADMQRLIMKLRAIAPAGGQFEMKGLTPVSAAITTRHQSESMVKVPTQATQPTGGTFGFLNPFSWGKR